MSVHGTSTMGGDVLCIPKAEAEEDDQERMDNHSDPVLTSSPVSDSMISEADEVLINEIGRDIPCDSHEAESVISAEMYGADLQRTLGEILAYCQVTYGAILKLDEKFEMLQAKVASIQNPAALSQKIRLTSSYRGSCHPKTESMISSDVSMPHLVHISSTSPLPSVESRKPPPLSPGPEVPSPPRLLIQKQTHVSAMTTPTNMIQEPLRTKMSLLQHLKRRKSLPEISPETSSLASTTELANTSGLGCSQRKVFLSNSILQKADKMASPGAAVRHITRNIFTAEELSQSSTTGNIGRGLKRLDPNRISAIREWVAKRYPKSDLRERGKDWKICLSVINSTARYFRFIDKTRKLKMDEKVKSENRTLVTAEPAARSSTRDPAAEVDVELSDINAEHRQQEMLISKVIEDHNMLSDWDSNSVYLGQPHRQVKVPEFVLSAAHLRGRPELIARYLIKFIFPEDVLVRSNVYGGVRRGIQALDHNKISALREHLLEHFPWMKLEEDGSDWKVCVGAINSSIRKFRYERKNGIKRELR